jgi:hypothetical protein
VTMLNHDSQAELPNVNCERHLAIDTIRAQLADRFGDRVTNASSIREAHGGSESYHAPQPPDLVAFPESTSEVREIVGICAAHGVPIVPFGAGTSLEGNASSPRGGVCVDTVKMNRVLAINLEDMDIVVQPGITRNKSIPNCATRAFSSPSILVPMLRSEGWPPPGLRARWPCVTAP